MRKQTWVILAAALAVIVGVAIAIGIARSNDDSGTSTEDGVATQVTFRADTCRNALSDALTQLETLASEFTGQDRIALEAYGDAVTRSTSATSDLGGALVGPCSDKVAAAMTSAKDSYVAANDALNNCYPDCNYASINILIRDASTATTTARVALDAEEENEADYLRERLAK